MQRKVKVNIYAVAIILLLSYFEIGAIRSFFFPNSIIQLGALGLALFIFFIKTKNIKISKYELLWFIAIITLVVFRNRYLGIGEFDNNIIYYFMLCIIITLTRSQTKWIKYFIEFMYYISIIHALATIIFAFVPTWFYSYTSHFLSPELYEEVVKRYALGTISGLCSNYGVNAGILAIGTGIAVIKYLWGDKENRKHMFLNVLVRLTGLLFTGKRSPALLLVLTIALIYISIEKEKTDKKIMQVILAGTIMLISVYILAMFIPQLSVLINRLLDSDDWSNLGGRTELYEEAIRMFKASPILGKGWNAYKLQTEKTIGRKYAIQYARMQTHNIYLQLLSETGIVGLLYITSLFLYPLLVVIKRTRKWGIEGFMGNQYKDNAVYMISCVYILIFFLFYGMSGNPLYDAYMYFLAFLSCGALQGYLYNDKYCVHV